MKHVLKVVAWRSAPPFHLAKRHRPSFRVCSAADEVLSQRHM